jgi:hypothetical protein
MGSRAEAWEYPAAWIYTPPHIRSKPVINSPLSPLPHTGYVHTLVQLGNNALVLKRELKENLPGISIQYSHLALRVQHCNPKGLSIGN